MKRKIIIISIVLIGFFLMALIIQYQLQVKTEIENSLVQSQDFNEEYQKEIASANDVVNQVSQYANTLNEGNYANEVSVPLNVEFESEEMAFVSELNHVLENKDVHNFINLFKQDEFRIWLSVQKIEKDPEKVMLSFMQESLKDIKAFNYYNKAGKHFLRINYLNGQEKNTELQVVYELDTLRFNLSFDEFKDYIQL